MPLSLAMCLAASEPARRWISRTSRHHRLLCEASALAKQQYLCGPKPNCHDNPDCVLAAALRPTFRGPAEQLYPMQRFARARLAMNQHEGLLADSSMILRCWKFPK